ncbi:MAG TPA: sigma-70 family RNA polymerase sigma factor [Pyrinomonadaceae bacterium]|jgi:RNA polymerase sigma-70 factor (ECF subfamily)|nr:sigma-70 family RNA polymerase sigma factor [Pyrinomonadaceae bacterium]
MGITHEMFFSKSVAIDDKDLDLAPVAAIPARVYSPAEPEFIERLRSGDAAAFDNLVTRYSGNIYGLAFRLSGDAEEAGDITQETFLAALKAIRSFRGDADLKTWLFRIAINQSRNRFRWWKRRNRDKTVSLDANVADSETILSDTIAGSGETPEENTLRRERQRRLSDALKLLPENYREAVVLCDIEGFSYEEIAESLDLNIGTVKSRIARGREELRKRLSDF